MCELDRDRDIKWVSVDDATNEDITCTFKELPGADWTKRQAAHVGQYVRSIIDSVP